MKKIVCLLGVLLFLCAWGLRRDIHPGQFDPSTISGITMWLDASDLDSLTNENLLLQSEDLGTTWSTYRSSVSTDTTANPIDGATTADTLIEDGTASNNHGLQQSSVSIVSGDVYSLSVYAKYVSRHLQLTSSAAGFGGATVNAKLDDCTVISSSNVDSASVESVTGGWCKVTAVFTGTSTTSSGVVYLGLHNGSSSSYNGDGSSNAILFGTQLQRLTNNGKYVPTTTAAIHGLDPQRRVGSWFSKVGSISFTQGTDANKPSRTVGSGNQENLVAQSNTFNNGSYWVVADVSLAKDAINPEGIANEAWTMTASSGTAVHRIYTASGNRATIVSGEFVHNSVYLKSGTHGSVYFGYGSPAAGIVVNTGTCAITDTNASSGTLQNATATDLGSGWCLASFEYTYTGGSPFLLVGFDNNDTASDAAESFNAAGTETFELFNASTSGIDSTCGCVITTDHAIHAGSPAGKSGVRFDGAASKMTSTSTLDDLFAADGKTVFMMVEPERKSGGAMYLLKDDGSNDWLTWISANNTFVRNNDGGADDSARAAAIDLMLIEYHHDGVNQTLRTTSADTDASGSTSDLSDTLDLGAEVSGNQYHYLGTMYEVLTYEKALDSGTRSRIRNYLCNKWGANC